MDGLGVLLTGTWDMLREPLYLGLFLALVMQLVGRSLIEGVRLLVAVYLMKQPEATVADEWTLRPLFTNLVAFGVGFVVTRSFVGEAFTGGQALYVAVLSAAAATQSYEFLKNLLAPFGIVLPSGYKWH